MIPHKSLLNTILLCWFLDSDCVVQIHELYTSEICNKGVFFIVFWQILQIRLMENEKNEMKRNPAMMNGNLTIDKAIRCWEKGTHPNTREVESTQGLGDSLRNTAAKLIVVGSC